MDRRLLRATFEEVPELYARARPGYPAALFDDLVALVDAAPSRSPVSPPPRQGGPRLLEIGPGPGTATAELVARGYEVTAVELGEGLAAPARRNVPQATIVTADFETWEPEGEFDAIAAFTAFHWLDPELRFAKAARLLRPGGALAVVETHHVLPPDGDPFFAAVQEDYDAVVPHPDNRPPPRPDETADLTVEFAATGLFEAAVARRHLWDETYTAAEYVAVLDTYSSNRALPPLQRHELYRRIRERIGAGTVRKSYLATLTAGRTRAS
jgi:SAM-dependent methyltransferase